MQADIHVYDGWNLMSVQTHHSILQNTVENTHDTPLRSIRRIDVGANDQLVARFLAVVARDRVRLDFDARRGHLQEMVAKRGQSRHHRRPSGRPLPSGALECIGQAVEIEGRDEQTRTPAG